MTMPRRPHTSRQAIATLGVLYDALPEWRHGYRLMQATGLKSGTLYPLLMRLADGGLLESRWEDSPQAGRPPRQLYRLTAEGQELARARMAEARETPASGARTA